MELPSQARDGEPGRLVRAVLLALEVGQSRGEAKAG